MFHGSGDVRLPFGLYNFPRCTQARGEERALEDKWLSFHWQACLFPPSGRLLYELRFDSRSGPRGVWEAASSDRSLTPREATEASRKPELSSPLKDSNRKKAQKHQKNPSWRKEKKWPQVFSTTFHYHWCNFRVTGFPLPHSVSITKPHKLQDFLFSPLQPASLSLTRKHHPAEETFSISSCTQIHV